MDGRSTLVRGEISESKVVQQGLSVETQAVEKAAVCRAYRATQRANRAKRVKRAKRVVLKRAAKVSKAKAIQVPQS
jgi:bisphosphoglycerate-independent phosphoglycerate mutase (AlkP superfamily)